MRGWIAAAALIVTVSISAAVVALQGSNGPARPSKSGQTQPMPSSTRDFLTPAESHAAYRAGLLPAGTKSLIKTNGQLRHGEFRWEDKDIPQGKLAIWVDLRRQMISVLRGGHEIGTSVVVYGADGMASPLGSFPIISKHRDYHSRAYDAPMPYSLFITNSGVALHGSPMSSRRATHGCIGLPIEFAQLLFAVARTGDRVDVVNSDPSVASKLAGAR